MAELGFEDLWFGVAWVAQLGTRPLLAAAQVMVSGSGDRAPRQAPCSAEGLLGILFPSPSAPTCSQTK